MKKRYQYFLPVGLMALCGALILDHFAPSNPQTDFLAGLGIGLSIVLMSAYMVVASKTGRR